MKKVNIHPFRLLSIWLLSLLIVMMATAWIVNAGNEETTKVEYIILNQSEYEEMYKEDYKEEESGEVENELQSSIKDETPIESIQKKTSLGQYTITKYCSCEKCCGEYAKNRPIKEDGTELVTGAYGTEITPNYSIAAPLPFGTKVEIAGLGTFKVADTTANWVKDKYGGKIIDVYVGSNHSDAVDYKEVLEVWEVE